MQRILTIVIAIVFVLALLAVAMTYTVRYTETAVLTTFGKAGEGDIKKSPGLYFRAPYPFQSVTKYDTRVRLLTVKLETQQTADARQVVVEGFCLWRVNDPLKFFQRFSDAGPSSEDHYHKAEGPLRENLRAAMALVSHYRLDELFTASPEGSKMGELESKMLEVFRKSADSSRMSLSDYGIAAVDVGISRIVLPEETTKAVFERMRTSRERIAQETDSRGSSQAQAIRARAESDAKRIKDFADRLAKDIRSQGELEAVPYYQQMNKNADLAVFLETMDFFRTAYGKRTTLVLSGSMPGVSLLFPNALDGLKSGEIPKLSMPQRNWLSRSMHTPGEPEVGGGVPLPNATGSTGREAH